MTDLDVETVIVPRGTQPHFTDLGNSDRLITAHGKDLRYVATWGKWLIFDEAAGIWRQDKTGEIARRMKLVARDTYKDAAAEEDAEIRKAMIAHALKMESEPSIRRAILLAATAAPLAMTHESLDSDPWALTCANGTLNLRTGELEPSHRERMATKRTPVAFDPAAACPRFIRFLDEVFLGDRELIEFVQRATGYSMTADTREHAVFICHGSGANGKTTLLRVLEHVLGDYAMTAETQTFLSRDKNESGPRNDVARLMGARFVCASEIGEGRRLDEGLVKSLTGGDTVTARFLHQEFFEFRPSFKLWIATNHKPHVRGTDEGIWRRIRLIPFKATFSPEKQDKNLIHALLAEAPGILAWIVRGCLAWQEEGLPTVTAVSTAVAEYRAEQDVLGSWLSDRCILNPAFSTANTLLYRDFSAWCERNGERPWSSKAFSMRLTERGIDGKKTKTGRLWAGIGLDGSPDADFSDDRDG